MENIKLIEIYDSLKFLIGLLGIISTILIGLKKTIAKQLEPLNKKVDKIDENQCRNFLVDFLADVEKGVFKDEIQTKRAYEVYEHYTKDLHKNSYIHDKWERLIK